jgi:single-stranded DNA-specific DHH superfamily exonuclease
MGTSVGAAEVVLLCYVDAQATGKMSSLATAISKGSANIISLMYLSRHLLVRMRNHYLLQEFNNHCFSAGFSLPERPLHLTIQGKLAGGRT